MRPPLLVNLSSEGLYALAELRAAGGQLFDLELVFSALTSSLTQV